MSMTMRIVKLIDRWARVDDAPVQRLHAARILVGLFATIYVLVRAPYFAGGSHDAASFTPVGLVGLVALIRSAPLPTWLMWSAVVITIASGSVFVINGNGNGKGNGNGNGSGKRIAAPIWFASLLFVTTYASSWGKILHSENLLVWHAAIVSAAFMLEEKPSRRMAKHALRALTLVTVLTYFVAGVTKLRSGGTGWISGEALGDWLAWDALRKIELGSLHSPLAPMIAASPLLVQLLAAFTLVVELGAPLSLFSRRIAVVWVVLAWMFHAGILAVMAIGFFYPLAGIAFVSIVPFERLSILSRFLPPVENEPTGSTEDEALRMSTPSLFH